MRKLVIAIVILASAAAGVYLGYVKGLQNSQRPTGPVVSVMFLDVQRGGGILIKSPEGNWAIIDPGAVAEKQALVDFLKWLEIKKLDVIVTNSSSNRVGAASGLFQEFKVARFVHAGQQDNSRTWLNLIRDVESRQIREQLVSAGDAIRLSPTTKLVVLSPPQDPISVSGREPEDNSLVLQLRFGEKRFLFPSDIRTHGEAYLIRQDAAVESDVLVLPRSGRTGSSSLEFVACVRPAYCVLSTGGRLGSPNPAVLERIDRKNSGADLYRTDKDGTIEMISDGKRMSVDIHVGDR